MNTRHAAVGCVGMVVLSVLAGCTGLFGGGADPTATATVTPAPVPSEEERPADGQQIGTPVDATATQSRYHALRPTCERPSQLVVHIQLGALRDDDPVSHEGINTTWRFATPSNRQATGSYDRFVNIITERYRPLLNAETVSFGPLERDGMTASQRVTVTTTNSETRSYVWYLERQTGGRYDGCWMTTGVRSSISDVGE